VAEKNKMKARFKEDVKLNRRRWKSFTIIGGCLDGHVTTREIIMKNNVLRHGPRDVAVRWPIYFCSLGLGPCCE